MSEAYHRYQHTFLSDFDLHGFIAQHCLEVREVRCLVHGVRRKLEIRRLIQLSFFVSTVNLKNSRNSFS